MLNAFQKIVAVAGRLLRSDRQWDEIKINQGRILCELHTHRRPGPLHEYEFKVFSQWGEDGIIQFLIANLPIKNKTFIEFGVEDFTEANCRFLLMKDHWSGLVLDGSRRNIDRLCSSYFYWRHQLQAKAAFITRDNAAALLDESGFDRELGILSVDIDGVDYYVLANLEQWRPSILIVEYNAVFGSRRAVSVPYDASFNRTNKHRSNLYYGASLPAFAYIAEQRGYSLVGVNSAGSNAFFVRNDLLNEVVKPVALTDCFRDSSFREGRDANGQLSFIAGRARRDVIADMPLVDVISNTPLRVRDLQD